MRFHSNQPTVNVDSKGHQSWYSGKSSIKNITLFPFSSMMFLYQNLPTFATFPHIFYDDSPMCFPSFSMMFLEVFPIFSSDVPMFFPIKSSIFDHQALTSRTLTSASPWRRSGSWGKAGKAFPGGTMTYEQWWLHQEFLVILWNMFGIYLGKL